MPLVNQRAEVQRRNDVKGVYLYAILAGECRRELGRLGLPAAGRVFTRPAHGFSAVVSEYQGPDITGLAAEHLLRYLRIHQSVIERAMTEQPVLPVKFGTVLTSQREIQGALARWHIRLASALEQLAGAVEIEVAATWDLKTVFAELARAPEIAALAATIAGQAAEEATATRVKVGRLVKETLDARRESVCRAALSELGSSCRAAQPNPLTSDELVMNVGFLVEPLHLNEFYAGIDRLDASFAGRLTFRCIGPLPPYSFATVEFVRSSTQEIEAARRMLELAERASEAEVDANYRRLAARWHPDHNLGDATAAGRFAALASSRRHLLAYLRACRGADGLGAPEQQFDLAQSAVGATLELVIRRAGAGPTSGGEGKVDSEHAAVAI
ncbi:MAG: GvpL/GvpF family gas vesicle protein [Chloroflexi bacterium]|nr:GvpL/GvpF family gas vesicle protein [Chloroflexota bacterium]